MLAQHRGDRGQRTDGGGREPGLAGRERHATHRPLERDHLGRQAVGAAVAVVDAVHHLGIADASVGVVADPIAVVVRIGAAVVVGVPIEIFGRVRAGVAAAEHPVVIVVDVRAAVVVIDAVDHLGVARAAVDLVGLAVSVAIGHVRAAVVVLEPVAALGRPRALVIDVGHPVGIGVGQARWPRRRRRRRPRPLRAQPEVDLERRGHRIDPPGGQAVPTVEAHGPARARLPGRAQAVVGGEVGVVLHEG